MTFRRERKKPQPLDEPALYDYAVKALGRRMRTVVELKRLMRSRVEEGEVGKAKILAVVDRLERQHYLDDTTYAATYTRLRQENEKLGKRRVAWDLSRKGVDSALIATTLEQGYENTSEEELARRHLERKRVKPPADEKKAARIARLLARAGFSSSTIFKILKDGPVNEETLTDLEALDAEESDPDLNRPG